MDEVATRLGVAAHTCASRMAALEANGVVSRRVALVDGPAVGFKVILFATVVLSRHERQIIADFENSAIECPNVLECYSMFDEADYFLKIVLPELEDFAEFRTAFQDKNSCVASLRAMVASKPVKATTALPL